MQHQRRAILKASAVAIIVYAIVVVVYANLIPSIGLRFYLNEVERIDRAPSDFDGTRELPVPRTGDYLVRIAGQTVDRDRAPLGTIVNTMANLQNEQKFPPAELHSLDELRGTQATLARVTKGNLDSSGRPRSELFVRLDFQNSRDDDRPKEFHRWYRVGEAPMGRSLLSIGWFALESVIFWLGWLVFRRHPEDDSTALFFLMCIVTVGAYMGWYHWVEIASSPALVFVFAACAMAVPQVSLHLHLMAPSPKRFLLRFPRVTLFGLYLAPGCLQLAILWAVSRMFYFFRHKQLQDGQWWEQTLGMLLWIYIVIGGLMFVGCLASLWHAYRYPRKLDDRDQVRWLLAGSAFAAVLIGYTFWYAVTNPAGFLVGNATWAMFSASLSFIASYAVSILRYRFLSIDETIEQKGWKYLIIRFVGAITFIGLVVALILMTPRIFLGVTQTQGLLIASFLVLVLYILNTIRGWLGAILDRRFYRERSQLDWAMRRMKDAVGRLVDPGTVQHRSLVIAANCVSAQGAAVYQREPKSGFVRTQFLGNGSFPERIEPGHMLIERLKNGELLQRGTGQLLREDVLSQQLRGMSAELAQPLISDDKLIGLLLLGPRREGSYNSSELAFLAGLANLATIALHAAYSQQTLEKLNTDLRQRVQRVSIGPPQRPSLEPPPPTPVPPSAPPLTHMEQLRGSGTAIGQILQTVRKVAASHSTVLLRGESGTGKSLLAEIIHRNSPRADGPFVKVHCAALSPTLLESELFGHVRGAFTGADRDKVGRFQMADGGTLFLDEVGDISLDTQTKLLRVLQEMTFERVGSSDSIRVDVRIIAATHQPLEEFIRRGRIREDLYYRLNVISIRMPSLRERREDILDLATHFLETLSAPSNKKFEGIEGDALLALQNHDWPGNIRELQNVLEHAAVMANGPWITLADLPLHNGFAQGLSRSGESTAASAANAPELQDGHRMPPHRGGGRLVDEVDGLERDRLLEALARAGGNKSRAARLLGLPRSTLCSKLQKYGLF